MIQILESPSASERLQVAGAFLGAAAPGTELRAAGVDPDTLAAAGAPAAQLAWLLAVYADHLDRARLADRATLLQAAAGAIASADRDPIVGRPTLLLDVAVETRSERALVA